MFTCRIPVAYFDDGCLTLEKSDHDADTDRKTSFGFALICCPVIVRLADIHYSKYSNAFDLNWTFLEVNLKKMRIQIF